MSITLYTAIGPVLLKESFEDYEVGIDLAAGPFINKKYLVQTWSSVDAVVNTLMGSATATTVGGRILRLFPHQCPESTNLYCLDARVENRAEYDNGDSGRPSFRLAVIKCHYGIPPKYDVAPADPGAMLNGFEQDDGAGNPTGNPYVYMTQSIDFDTEVIKLPGSAYTFASTPRLNVDTSVAKTIGTAQLVFARKIVPYFPVALILAKMNRLNNATFLGQPKGLIRFAKARTRREASSDGTRTQEIELVFKWREFDHNKQHRPDEASFDFIKDPSGNMPYIYTDLTPLLADTYDQGSLS